MPSDAWHPTAGHESAEPRWLPREGLESLIALLARRGYRVLGPVRREGAVVLGEVRALADLPVGWRDVQEPGAYRLERSGPERSGDRADAERVFDVVNGMTSLKPLTFAPREPLLRIESEETGEAEVPGGLRAAATLPRREPVAVLGVRACDLAGLAVQDRIFLRDRVPDPWYASRREGLLLVGVSCTRAVSTCFCASLGTGPELRGGYDLGLTELGGGFLVRAGSPAGAELLPDLDPAPEPAPAARLCEEREALRACAEGQSRRLETHDLPGLLYANLEHPRWDDVAERCLSCGNCTSVCPTCFCHDVFDEPGADGCGDAGSLRVRAWSSCFDPAHVRIHGMNFRPHIRDRYRQWLVHKVASWIDQFGTSGCIGCGRCITWCPVGIDLTEEVAATRGSGGESRGG